MVNTLFWLMIKIGLRTATIDAIFYDLTGRHLIYQTEHNKRYERIKKFYIYLEGKS